MIKRPNFIVETMGGRNLDANHLTIGWDVGWNISFICSGVITIIPIEFVKEIRFSKEGSMHCNECDGPIPNRG